MMNQIFNDRPIEYIVISDDDSEVEKDPKIFFLQYEPQFVINNFNINGPTKIEQKINKDKEDEKIEVCFENAIEKKSPEKKPNLIKVIENPFEGEKLKPRKAKINATREYKKNRKHNHQIDKFIKNDIVDSKIHGSLGSKRKVKVAEKAVTNETPKRKLEETIDTVRNSMLPLKKRKEFHL